MNFMRKWVAAACLAILTSSASAQSDEEAFDRVRVRYIPGNVRLDHFESMDIQFLRFPNSNPLVAGRKPDAFFDEIGRILAKHNISSNWQYVLPDGPSVEIQIRLDGRVIRLNSAHTLYESGGRLVATERGVTALEGRALKEVIAQESEGFRSRRLAFEEILALVPARIRKNLAQ